MTRANRLRDLEDRGVRQSVVVELVAIDVHHTAVGEEFALRTFDIESVDDGEEVEGGVKAGVALQREELTVGGEEVFQRPHCALTEHRNRAAQSGEVASR